MLKILVLCNQISTAKALINNVISNIRDLQLVGIANSSKEALKLIEKNEPNLIISTNENVISLIKENFKYYTPGIILISKPKDDLTDFYYKNLLHLHYALNFEKITNYIINYIDNNYFSSKRKKAQEILASIGFNFKLTGTVYLLDSILYANTYKGSYSFEKLKKDIYSHIAIINNTTIDRVKWSIARSINYMYQKHTKTTYANAEKYFGIEYPSRPTPKQVISSIASILDL